MKHNDISDLATRLFNLLEENNVQYLCVGSLPLSYILPSGKTDKPSDIDIVVPGSPEEILSYLKVLYGEDLELKENRLIRRVRPTRITHQIEYYPTSVYSVLSNGNQLPFCIFGDGTVNIIKVDFNNPYWLDVDGNRIRLPNLGEYYITRLHPWAITESRCRNTGLLIETFRYKLCELEEYSKISKERLRQARLNYGLSDEEFRKARNFALNMADRKRWSVFREYIDGAYDLKYIMSTVVSL